ncbi:minichromosome maintenance protein MCM [Halorubrum sp. Eb13]|uniref:AAA family ATPase n=1 Tax=Halorubrum sp. Eb13 TaxID=1383843 RepID=UPI000B992B81|nr:minichromosome maintenance protein MCM [Halorubrum sp. Eb13]OYR42882.1 hypothetical protein DJ75_12350 [Halorubrum sp. Eb13]
MASHPDAEASSVARQSTKADKACLTFGPASTDPVQHSAYDAFFTSSTGEQILEVTIDEIGDALSSHVDDVSKEEAIRIVSENSDEYLMNLVDWSRENGYDDVSIQGSPLSKRVEDIRADDIGHLVEFDVRCTDRTEQYPSVFMAIFTCKQCGSTVEWEQSRSAGKLDKPPGCPSDNCAKKYLEYEETLTARDYFVDTQQAILQDLHQHSTTANPEDIKADLYNHHVGSVEPGDKATVTAVVRVIEKEEKQTDFFLQITDVELQHREFEAIELTEEDEQAIKELSEDPEIIDRLASSIAPKISGEEYMLARKAALYQMFGGVDHSNPGEYARHVIHVAYVGDSGVGKSKLAKATARIAPTSVYKSADNVTEVGLTAAVTHEERFDTSKWTVSGGALVRADGGHAVIDELDKAPDSIQGSLQEPLSEGTVSVSKSKVHAKLYSRCSALLIANPHNGNFDVYQPLADQIKFNPAVWDRMDIIVPFLNKADEEKDSDIADGVFDQINGDGEANVVSEDMMQKYIAYARHINPEWDDDAMERVKGKWKSIRASSGDGRVTIGPRQLEGMVRIAEASARARLSDTVTMEDAENSLSIMTTWMSLLMTDESGAWDIEALSGVTAAQRKPEDEMWRAIQFHDTGEGAVREDVIDRMKSRTDLDRSEVQQTINSATGRQDAEQDTTTDGAKVLFDRR